MEWIPSNNIFFPLPGIRKYNQQNTWKIVTETLPRLNNVELYIYNFKGNWNVSEWKSNVTFCYSDLVIKMSFPLLSFVFCLFN